VLQYWDEAGAAWRDVPGASAYGTSTTEFNNVTFDAVTTPRVRATIQANGNGTTWSAVAVTEWRVFADDPGTQPAEVPVTVTAQSRCLAGRAYVAVQVRNDHDTPVAVEVETAYGERSFPSVAPGANAYQSFATRAASAAAGSVTVRATGTVGGKTVTTVYTADYAGLTCTA
jgi:hypothetical protein